MRALVVAALLAFVSPSAEAQTTIKIATLAPEGSSWMKLFHAWQSRVEARSEGRIKIKFYAGGLQGDERDMLRKIRLGQLSGAAVTGIGLSSISPEARALEIARTDEQLEGLRAALAKDIEKSFFDKGYMLVNWGDVGPVYLFAKRPVKTLDDLRLLHLWMWNEDPVSRQLFTALGLHGVPLGVPEVLPGLSTGQIDSFFGSPLATIALQWSTHARYMIGPALSMATGATVVSKKVWDALPPADQKILQEESAAMQADVLKQVRADNVKALEVMRQKGLQVMEMGPELRAELDRAAEAVARANAGTVPKAFQDKVQKLVDEYRAAVVRKK
jgi:TRAP-type C4-dicarboxylate transport system substrate-binding protein